MYYAPEGLSTDLMVLSYCGLIALSKQEGKAFAASIGLWEGESASLPAFFGKARLHARTNGVSESRRLLKSYGPAWIHSSPIAAGLGLSGAICLRFLLSRQSIDVERAASATPETMRC